jgi:hypothetical protein
MMDPREFKAPFITIEDIRSAVAEFRSQYWPRDTIPVDIFAIVEFELDIEIRTIVNLREAGDVDALLLGDLKTIVVGQNDFLNKKKDRVISSLFTNAFLFYPSTFCQL